MYYMGFSYKEIEDLPVVYKRWFLDRVVKEINQTSKEGNTQSRAAHANSPDVRATQGRTRQSVPAKLRRFT
jgi:hypothetical protein